MISPHVAADSFSELKIAVDHPSFAGHFPGAPLLPGAVLMDMALDEIARARRIDLTHWRLASAKFLQPVRPGALLRLEHSAPNDTTIRFVVRAANDAVASGSLSAMAAAAEGSHGD